MHVPPDFAEILPRTSYFVTVVRSPAILVTISFKRRGLTSARATGGAACVRISEDGRRRGGPLRTSLTGKQRTLSPSLGPSTLVTPHIVEVHATW